MRVRVPPEELPSEPLVTVATEELSRAYVRLDGFTKVGGSLPDHKIIVVGLRRDLTKGTSEMKFQNLLSKINKREEKESKAKSELIRLRWR
jgi:hypothetical protein